MSALKQDVQDFLSKTPIAEDAVAAVKAARELIMPFLVELASIGDGEMMIVTNTGGTLSAETYKKV